jgi:hypothetical protein
LFCFSEGDGTRTRNHRIDRQLRSLAAFARKPRDFRHFTSIGLVCEVVRAFAVTRRNPRKSRGSERFYGRIAEGYSRTARKRNRPRPPTDGHFCETRGRHFLRRSVPVKSNAHSDNHSPVPLAGPRATEGHRNRAASSAPMQQRKEMVASYSRRACSSALAFDANQAEGCPVRHFRRLL